MQPERWLAREGGGHSFPLPSRPQQGDKLWGLGLWPALGGHAGVEDHNFPLSVTRLGGTPSKEGWETSDKAP